MNHEPRKIASFVPLTPPAARATHVRTQVHSSPSKMAGPSARLKRAAPGPGLEDPRHPSKKQTLSKQLQLPHYYVNKHLLASLGGGWTNMPPFSGDEDKLYRWVAEPALWARVIMGDVEPRMQQRLIGLHAGLHDGIDASGFVLWRSFAPTRPGLTVSVQATTAPGHCKKVTQQITLPSVTIRQHKLTPSSHFGEGWEMRTHVGPPASPTAQPAWLRGAWQLIQTSTFPFLGGRMPVVDAAWTNDRLSRTDAITHALCEMHPPTPTAGSSSGDGDDSSSKRGFGSAVRDWVLRRGRGSGGSTSSSGRGRGKAPPQPTVAAAAIETPFPAERLLRSLVGAGKDDEVLYIDAIMADQYGAAYRLLCDMVAARQALHPERRLVVVLMAVVSSDVLGRYMRWGFSYGGIMPSGHDESKPPVLIDRIDRLHSELTHFEQALARPCAPSPTSVVHDDRL
jgi:hypothetical protein